MVIESEKKIHPYERDVTNRELQVLELLAEGFSNKTIAKILKIKSKTVDNYISKLSYKLLFDDIEIGIYNKRIKMALMFHGGRILTE